MTECLKNITPAQKKEINVLRGSLDEAFLKAENLLNQFQPGSDEYMFFHLFMDSINNLVKEIKGIKQ